MKFARYIETLQRDCPTEWRGKFIRCAIECRARHVPLAAGCGPPHRLGRKVRVLLCKRCRYKELKKALKRAAGGRDDERVDPAKEDDFFHLLERQMVSINKCAGARVWQSATARIPRAPTPLVLPRRATSLCLFSFQTPACWLEPRRHCTAKSVDATLTIRP